MPEIPVIGIENLVVEYGRGAGRTRAVDGITMRVNQGECVGFIGANGAGRSSTIKTIMGFIFPASGTVSVFGSKAGTVESRRRIGYLPEVALYYPFMKARELLELYGGLSGLPRRALRERIPCPAGGGWAGRQGRGPSPSFLEGHAAAPGHRAGDHCRPRGPCLR